MGSARYGRLRFGNFELDPTDGLLLKNGDPIKLSPQPFRALVLLAHHRGRLVSREELRQEIWGNEVVVDFEHGLNTCIRQIRTSLGDESIQTVPRLGYRFRIPVTDAVSKRFRATRWTFVAAALVLAASTIGLWLSIRYYLGSLTRDSDLAALYVRGRATLEGHNAGSARVALSLFEQAVGLNPKYARGYVGMSEAYQQMDFNSVLAAPEARLKAAEATRRALELGRSLPEAHLASAMLKLYFERDWNGAVQESRAAIALDPNDATAHERYAIALVLNSRFSEAIEQARIAEALDPRSTKTAWSVATILYYARRCDEAMAQARRVLELDPTYGWAYHTLGQCYEEKGMYDESIGAYLRSGRPSGNLGHAYAVSGHIAEARKLLSDFERQFEARGTRAGDIARIYIGLGEYDRALTWLETSEKNGEALWTLKVAPVWDPLRAEPRFAKIVSMLGYPD